jgi:hypothetical protein
MTNSALRQKIVSAFSDRHSAGRPSRNILQIQRFKGLLCPVQQDPKVLAVDAEIAANGVLISFFQKDFPQ